MRSVVTQKAADCSFGVTEIRHLVGVHSVRPTLRLSTHKRPTIHRLNEFHPRRAMPQKFGLDRRASFAIP